MKLKVGSMGEEVFIPISCQKLMDFCYECGKLGHVLEDCSSSSDTAEEQDCNSRFGTGVEDLSYEDWPGGVRKGGDEKYRELRIENRGGLGRLL